MTRPAASKPLLEPQAEAGPRPVGAAGGGRRSPAHGVCQGPGLNPGQWDGVASGSGDPATRKQRRGLGAAWGARRGGPALLRAGTQGPACVLLHGVILSCASVVNAEPGPGLGSSGAGGHPRTKQSGGSLGSGSKDGGRADEGPKVAAGTDSGPPLIPLVWSLLRAGTHCGGRGGPKAGAGRALGDHTLRQLCTHPRPALLGCQPQGLRSQSSLPKPVMSQTTCSTPERQGRSGPLALPSRNPSAP